MYATPDEFSTAAQAHIETSLALANTVFTSVECLTTLHLNTARTLFEDGVAGFRARSGAKAVHDVAVLQIAMAQPVFEKVIRYSGSLHEIAFQSSKEVSRLITSQLAYISTNAISGPEKTLKNFPPNSDATSASFRPLPATARPAQGSPRKTSTKVAGRAGRDVAGAVKSRAAPKVKKAA
jgi:phasin family protein